MERVRRSTGTAAWKRLRRRQDLEEESKILSARLRRMSRSLVRLRIMTIPAPAASDAAPAIVTLSVLIVIASTVSSNVVDWMVAFALTVVVSAMAVIVPLPGPLTIEIVDGAILPSGSVSLASTSSRMVVPMMIVAESSCATGGLLSGLTVVLCDTLLLPLLVSRT